jgi:hypothetical protein
MPSSPQQGIPLHDCQVIMDSLTPNLPCTWCISVQHFWSLSRMWFPVKLFLLSSRNSIPTWSLPISRNVHIALTGHEEATCVYCLSQSYLRSGWDYTHLTRDYPKGRGLPNSAWFDWCEIESSRVSSVASQRGGRDSCSSSPGHPEAQPMPDGAVPLLPAMPLCKPDEGSKFRCHEVTWVSCSFSYPTFVGCFFCVASLSDARKPGIK